MQLQPAGPTANGPADKFTGDVYVDGLSAGPDAARLIAAAVKFTPVPAPTGTSTPPGRRCTAPRVRDWW